MCLCTYIMFAISEYILNIAFPKFMFVNCFTVLGVFPAAFSLDSTAKLELGKLGVLEEGKCQNVQDDANISRYMANLFTDANSSAWKVR